MSSSLPPQSLSSLSSLLLSRSLHSTISLTLRNPLLLVCLSFFLNFANLPTAYGKKPRSKSARQRGVDTSRNNNDASNSNYRRNSADYSPRKTTEERISQFFNIFKYTYLLLFTPILGYFFYSIIRDPALPEIITALRIVIYKKWMGYLGSGRGGVDDVDLESKRR